MRILIGILVCLLLLPLPLAAQSDSADCGSTSFDAGLSDHTITTAAGDERDYLLYIPAHYDGSTPVPLVLNLHGFLGTARQMSDWTGWNELAETENFIVAYPQGGGIPTRWNAGNAGFIGDYDVDDVAFLAELIDAVKGDLCIDAAQVFMSGLSNGGGMTNRFACQVAGVVAAIGTVSGAYTEFDGECNNPTPVIAFHGTADPIVPFEGVDNANGYFPHIMAWALNWSLLNGCDADGVSVPVNTAIIAGAFAGCDADVILYVIHGGSHVWPGANPTTALTDDAASAQIDATQTIWAFFKTHPLPEN